MNCWILYAPRPRYANASNPSRAYRPVQEVLCRLTYTTTACGASRASWPDQTPVRAIYTARYIAYRCVNTQLALTFWRDAIDAKRQNKENMKNNDISGNISILLYNWNNREMHVVILMLKSGPLITMQLTHCVITEKKRRRWYLNL